MRTSLLLAVLLTASLAGAAGRELAPRPIAPTSYETGALSTAYAGNRFLTVWRETMGELGNVIRGSFADENGTRISETSFAVATTPNVVYSMHAVGTGDSYALFHYDYEAVRMADVDLQGRLTALRTLDLPPLFGASIAWNGRNFLVVQEREQGTDAWVLDRAGRHLREPLRLDGHGPRVTATGNAFLVVTSSVRGLQAHRIDHDLTVTTRILAPLHEHALPGSVIVAGAENGDAVVGWVVGEQSSALRVRFLPRSGDPGDELTVVENAGPIVPLGVMRDDAGYAITFKATTSRLYGAEAFTYAARISANGSREGEPVRTSSLPVNETAATTNGRVVLTAWIPNWGHSRQVYSSVLGNSARPLETELISAMPRRQLQPVLVGTGSTALAAWSEKAGNTRLTRAASVDLDGRAGAVTDVASNRLASRELGFDGSQALALHSDGLRLDGSPVRLDGTLAAEESISITGGIFDAHAAVFWARNRWLVVSPSGEIRETLRFTTVSRDGRVLLSRELHLDTPLEPGETRWFAFASLAFNGRDVLLVWSEYHDPYCMMPACEPGVLHTYASRITTDGELIDEPLLLSKRTVGGTSAASNGAEFFVTHGPTAHVLSAGTGEPLRVKAERELLNWPQTESDVTWDGREYVVAMRYRGRNWYLASRRFDRAGNEFGTFQGTQTLPADEFAPPSIASVMANDALIGVQEGDTGGGMRAVVYRERDFAPLPAPPQPPRNVRVQPIVYGLYRITWDPPDGPEPEAYAVEIRNGNEWLPLAVTASNVRELQTYRGNVRVRAFNAGGGSPETEAVPLSRPVRRRSAGR